jgi:hypothetical protein
MEIFVIEQLELKYATQGNRATMEWWGKSVLMGLDEKLLRHLEQKLSEWNGHELSIDLRNLEYMNSATVSVIVNLIKMLHKSNIKSEIIYDLKSKWQELCFSEFKIICKVYNNISISGKE